MSAGAVRKYGTSTMAGINRGSLSETDNSERGGDMNNSINITVNVSSEGTTQTVTGDNINLNSKEFANRIKSAVVDVIQQQKRVGGSLR